MCGTIRCPPTDSQLASDHAVGLRGRHGHPQSAPDDRRRSSLRARDTTAAANNPQGISWHDWFPSLGLRWEMPDFKRIAALVRFNRYGHRLPPGALAYGDSSAPTANVYRGRQPARIRTSSNWARSSRASVRAPAATRRSARSIRQLERPYVNELTFGFESRPERSHDRPDDRDRPSRGPARRRGQYRRSDILLYVRSR